MKINRRLKRIATALARAITRPIRALQERGVPSGPETLEVRLLESSGDGLGLLTRDTAERKATEDALHESERTLSTLLSNLPGIAYRCQNDRHWTMEFVSEGCFELTGYQPADLIKNRIVPYGQLIHPEDREIVWHRTQAALQEHKPFDYSYRLIAADGTEKWVWEQGQGIFSTDGTLLALEGFITDLTERTQAEQELQKTQARLTGIIDSAMDAIITVDASQRIVLFNPAAEKMFGLPASAALGQPVDRFIPERFRSAHAQHIKDFGQTGVTNRGMGSLGTITGLRADGEEFPVEASISQVEAKGQRLFTAILRDVTEQKKAEEALERYANRLEILHEIDKAILAAQSAEATAQAALKHLQSLVPYQRSSIGLFDFESQEIIILALHSYRDDRLEPGMRFSLESFAEVIDELKHGRVQTIADTKTIPNPSQLHQTLKAAGFRSFLSAPLRSSEKLIGALTLWSGRPHAFSDEHRQIVHEIADQMAVAIQNAQLADRFRQVITSISDHIYMTEVTKDGRHQNHYLSPNVEALTGYPTERFMADWRFWASTVIHPEDRATAAVQAAHLTDGQHSQTEYRLIRADDEIIWVRDSARVVEVGSSKFIYGVISDITAHKNLEEQFYQAQKMEAVGQLAGGVAHDFNNLLTVITGLSEIILTRDLNDDDPIRQKVEQIKTAGERAAALTRQLLAFSRKQMLQPQIVDLNRTVRDMDKMLRRLIGEDIDLITKLGPELEGVKIDPGQVDQVIMNLAVNARGAMPNGGWLTIETANVELDERYADRHFGVTPGAYVMLAISDSGHGMDAATRARIFEPFFTTKEHGKGTGLGLAVVHGIIKQSGGHIWVYSEPERGTSFKIYLPQVGETPQTIQQPSLAQSLAGSETILIVEDDDMVQEIISQTLIEEGYKVLTARHGPEAVQTAQQYDGPIHLLVTDVVLPGGRSGPQVAEAIAAQRAGIKVLYISGYTDNAIVHHGVLDPDKAFLEKPFSPMALLHKIREVLDQAG